MMSPHNDLCSSETFSQHLQTRCCWSLRVSHLQHRAGVRVGEAGRLVEPQNQVTVRQTGAVQLQPFAAPLGVSRFLLGRTPKAKQALVVESIRSFEGQKKG